MALGNGTVKVSWVPGAISWPACCAAAGYQISQGNRRSRAASSSWMVRTPTGNRPRTNGSYSDVACADHFWECSFACLIFSSVIKNPLLLGVSAHVTFDRCPYSILFPAQYRD